MRPIASIIVAGIVAISSSAQAAEALKPPADWKASIDKYLEGKLLDPYSAVKQVTRGPRYARLQLGFFKMPPGWLVCYSVNAKNPYGGYTGATTYLFRVDEAGVQQDLHDPNISLTIDAECALPADPAPAAAKAEEPKTAL